MTRPKASRARPPERDYSHRSLLDKLGVKPALQISVLGLRDGEFMDQLVARGSAVSPGKARASSDLVFLAAESKGDLSRLKSLVPTIQRNGAIWVVYPKGQAHIRESDLIAAAKSAGLVDNKVVRFSETHTALRLVIPLAMR